MRKKELAYTRLIADSVDVKLIDAAIGREHLQRCLLLLGCFRASIIRRFRDISVSTSEADEQSCCDQEQITVE
jgi:hypothetical protein